MSEELVLSIVQRVRSFLQCEDERSAFELAQGLRNYRDQINPDLFDDEEAKAAAVRRLKEVDALLVELVMHIERETVAARPIDFLAYRDQYERLRLQRDLDAARVEIENLKQRLSLREWSLEDVTRQLKEIADDTLKKEIAHLETLYRPTRQTWASVGIAFMITGVAAVVTRIEEVSLIIRKYSPISDVALNTTLFGILLIAVAVCLKRHFDSQFIRRKISEVCSSMYAVAFIDYLRNGRERIERDPNKFTEQEAFEFIHGSASWWKTILCWCGCRMYQIDTVDQLKNCFIGNLLRKKLIAISSASSLDRRFTIVGQRSYETDF